MFVAEILSLFNFLSHHTQKEIEVLIPNLQGGSTMLEFISIGVVPALILAGSSYMLSRRYGSRPVGSMIVAGGAVLLGGMYYANYLLSTISASYLVTELT